jgi:hypothetical protein
MHIPEGSMLAWKVTPDPQGAFESMFVGSFKEAAKVIEVAMEEFLHGD